MVRTVALFVWGDVIERFLDPLGLDAAGFAEKMTGGWLFGYAEALWSAGIEPIIIAPSSQASAVTTIRHRHSNTDIVFVPGRRVPSLSPSAQAVGRWATEPLRAFREVILARGVEALLCQEYEDARLDRLIGLGKALNIPVYATFQGGHLTRSMVERLVRTRTIAKAAGLIVASQEERERLRARYAGSLPTVVDIANPLRTDEWVGSDRAAARAMLGLPDKGRIAICHGRIEIWRKGLDTLIAAWERVNRRPDDRLVIIGTGTDRDPFAKVLAVRNPSGVQWIDRYTTDRAEMRQWLSAADVFVSASRVEGMPVAPLEAMACGLPVVGTDAQGMGDIVLGGAEPCGMIVPRVDDTALAAAIDAVFGDPMLRKRLSLAARRRVESHFSVTMVGQALATFLRSGS